MKKFLFFLKVLWAWWYFIVFTLVFIILLPFFAVALSNHKGYPFANRLRVLWARVLFFFTGIRFRIIRHAKLKKKQRYIFCANHFSYLDIPVSALTINRNWCFVAKSELANIPLLNIFFKTIDISMNRENARESLKALQEAKQAIDSGLDIVIYPEGKIDDHPPRMAPFKNGPFRLAIEKQIPIVPFSMIDNWKILYVNGWKMYGCPGVARAIMHDPVDTTGLTINNLAELKEKVFRIVDEDLRRYWPDKF